MFDTKIALIVRDDLATWQRLNVVAFLASGIASAAPEVMGEPYVDSNGHRYGNMLGQPMLVFEANLSGLQVAHRRGIERELTLVPYVKQCSRLATMKQIARFFLLRTDRKSVV